MRIGMLGSGRVAQAIATRLVQAGHEVRLGSRTAANEGAAAWTAAAGVAGSHGTFADAAAFGELLVNCTEGVHSQDALEAAGRSRLAGKVLVDVANPLAEVNGRIGLATAHGDSLGEQLQRSFPDVKVVKALNGITYQVAIDPGSVPGAHICPICGDDAGAKGQVRDLLAGLGWPKEHVLDLGGIEASRDLELYVPLCIAIQRALGTPHFNIAAASPQA
jgi:predicted dinucleotide-binding enzyme